MSQDLSHKIKNSVFWSYLTTGSLTIIQFIAGVVLARLLEPDDFGIFIAATAFTSIITIQIQFGLPQALLQRDSINSQQINSSFWFMIINAVIAVIASYFFVDFLEDIYADANFKPLYFITCISFFIIPYVSISSTILRRDMNFKTLSKINIIVSIISVPLSITLALTGFGPYSLAITGIVTIMLSAIMLFLHSRWIPQMPSISSLKTLLSYAWHANLNKTMDMAMEKVDKMMIGGLLNTTQLGYYNRSFSLAQLPLEQLGQSIQPVIFGSLSRVQNDTAHSLLMYQKFLCSLSLIVFPFLLLFLFIADDFILFIYGEKWLPASPPLKVLIFATFLGVITLSFKSFIAAQNLVKKEVPVNFFSLLLMIFIIYFLSEWGLLAIAAGMVFKEFIQLILLRSILGRSDMKLNWSMILFAIAPALIAIIFSSIVSFFTWELAHYFFQSTFMRLCIVSFFLLSSYTISVIILNRIWPAHQPLSSIVSNITSLINKRRKQNG